MTSRPNRAHSGVKGFEQRALTAALLCTSLCSVRSTAAAIKGPLKPVGMKAVRITDNFWAPKLEVYRTNTVEHSWPYIEDNIKAMKKIAGLSDAPCKTGRWTEANLYKYMETVAYSLALHPDTELEKHLEEVISAIAAAQRPDGYIHAHITVNNLTPWGDLYHQHDGYVAGHLYEAAVAHFRVTGKTAFLDVARKSADQACRYFLDEKNPGFPGHAEIELALVELYRVTGEERYLELGRTFIERRGQNKGKDCPRCPCEYFQDHLPIREQREIRGHAVRAIFFSTGVADVALETGDSDMRAAARRLWASVTRRKMYITGSIGASQKHEAFGEDYELPNEGYCESCAACGLADFAHRMALLEGDAECADVLERVLYNGVLHGISLDGKSFYYRNPLTDKDHLRENNWCCCPPNLSRTLMKVGGYAYATGDSDIYVNLYIGGMAEISLGGDMVTLTQQTQYPWGGKVRITVDPKSACSFSLNLRIPGWCRSARVKLNGAELTRPSVLKGYVCINRSWQAGDAVELDFAMPVERIEAHPNVAANQGLAAIQRGPVVYGLEGEDNDGKVDVVLAADSQFETEPLPDFLGRVTVVKGKCAEGKTFTAIPSYVLANRGKSSQVVWLNQKGKKANPAGWRGRLYRRLDPETLIP